MADPKRPPPGRINAIIDEGVRHTTARGCLKLVFETFPEIDVDYLRDVVSRRTAALEERERELHQKVTAGKAVSSFLRTSGFTNLLEASVAFGLGPQEMWDHIMVEAGIPVHEMPLTIQIGGDDG